MANGINFEPFRTQGSFRNAFNIESRGLVQGDAQADPAVRLQLSTGWLPNDLSAPVFGGMPIVESISTAQMNVAGATIRAATDASNGICVFNQAYHGIITAGNNVPQYLAGGTVHYYRYGSLARIPLPISDAVKTLMTSGENNTDQQFVWDADNLYVALASEGDGGGGSSTPQADPPAQENEQELDLEELARKQAMERGSTVKVAATPRAPTGLALPIKLLYISPDNNMTINRDSNGSLTWNYDAACGLFMI